MLAFTTELDWIYSFFTYTAKELGFYFYFNTHKLWREKKTNYYITWMYYFLKRKLMLFFLWPLLPVICFPYGLAQFIVVSLICVFCAHPFGWLPPPLPSSLRPRAPGKHRRAFGTCNRMNFSFTRLRQLSPPLSSSPFSPFCHWRALSPARAALAHLLLL